LRVYKFLDLKFGEKVLREKRLKISNLLELNDPFDCRGVNFPSPSDRITWANYIEHLSQKIGIVCFSESWSNPVIWGHYSGKATGIALGFEIPDAESKRVEYETDLIRSAGWKNLDRKEKVDLSIAAFRRKYKHWEYEKEVRFIVEYDSIPDSNGMQFINFGTDLILKEVVFGPLFPRQQARMFRNIADSRILYTTTRMAFQSFSVTLQKDKRRQL
jgi:hypothetical protein